MASRPRFEGRPSRTRLGQGRSKTLISSLVKDVLKGAPGTIFFGYPLNRLVENSRHVKDKDHSESVRELHTEYTMVKLIVSISLISRGKLVSFLLLIKFDSFSLALAPWFTPKFIQGIWRQTRRAHQNLSQWRSNPLGTHRIWGAKEVNVIVMTLPLRQDFSLHFTLSFRNPSGMNLALFIRQYQALGRRQRVADFAQSSSNLRMFKITIAWPYKLQVSAHCCLIIYLCGGLLSSLWSWFLLLACF